MRDPARRAAALAVAVLPLAAPAAAQERASAFADRPARPPAESPAPDNRAPEAALRVLDVPFVPQSEALCGGAAVSMVFRYWGERGVRAEDFGHLVTADGRGIPTDRLVAAVRRRGWSVLAFEGDRRELRRQVERGRPVIALLEVARGRHHYVVVVASWAGSIAYHDPARAPWRVEAGADFDRAWAATGRWALVLVPGDGARGGAGGVARGGPPPGDAASDAVRARIPDAATPGCASAVERATRLARQGRLSEAESLLAEAAATCGSRGIALRELAGVRLRQGRWGDAERLALEALGSEPDDGHALQTLATARYMAGRDGAALAAWAEAGRASLDLVRVAGLERTRHAAVTRLLGLRAARPLTPGRLRAARRRLGLLPAAAATRLDYRPVGHGKVEVRAAVLERPLAPTSPPRLLALGLRALARGEADVTAAGPTGAGEAWRIVGRWSDARPGVELSLTIPARLGVPGVWRAAGSWERERWRAADPAPTGRDAGILEGTRRTASLAVESWATGWLRWRSTAGFERWREAAAGSEREEARLVVGGEVEARPRGDRLSARLELGAWPSLGDGAPVGRSAMDLRWRSVAEGRGTVLSGRLGVAVVSSGAPRFLWPGAGTGRARPGLLRAHPLVHAGAISGPAFGPRLVHGGTELVRWLGGPPAGSGWPLGLGVAAFLDAAAAGGPSRDRPLLLDAGLGGRAELGGAGRLRLDLARGLADGKTAVSLGWEAAWPGR